MYSFDATIKKERILESCKHYTSTPSSALKSARWAYSEWMFRPICKRTVPIFNEEKII